jgi:plastocyanin
MTWRTLLRYSALGVAATLAFLVIVNLAAGNPLDPFFLVIGGLFVLGSVWTGLWRGGATFTLVILVLWFLLTLAFGGLASLTRPASWAEFIAVIATIVFYIAGVIAYVRGKGHLDDPAPAARGIVRVSTGVLVLAIVFGAAAGALAQNDVAKPGDVRLEASDFDFTPTELSAPAGEVGVFVENQDPAQHDFTIEGVVHLSLPAFKDRRATFTLQPGSYAFVCTLHEEDMAGTLKVT